MPDLNKIRETLAALRAVTKMSSSQGVPRDIPVAPLAARPTQLNLNDLPVTPAQMQAWFADVNIGRIGSGIPGEDPSLPKHTIMGPPRALPTHIASQSISTQLSHRGIKTGIGREGADATTPRKAPVKMGTGEYEAWYDPDTWEKVDPPANREVSYEDTNDPVELARRKAMEVSEATDQNIRVRREEELEKQRRQELAELESRRRQGAEDKAMERPATSKELALVRRIYRKPKELPEKTIQPSVPADEQKEEPQRPPTDVPSTAPSEVEKDKTRKKADIGPIRVGSRLFGGEEWKGSAIGLLGDIEEKFARRKRDKSGSGDDFSSAFGGSASVESVGGQDVKELIAALKECTSAVKQLASALGGQGQNGRARPATTNPKSMYEDIKRAAADAGNQNMSRQAGMGTSSGGPALPGGAAETAGAAPAPARAARTGSQAAAVRQGVQPAPRAR